MAFQSSRIERMRKAMQEHDLDVLYIRELSNIIWATGFEDVFDTEDAHALIVSQDSLVLHSDFRYEEALRREASSTDIVIDTQRSSHQALLAKIIKSIQKTQPIRVGIENSLKLSEYRSLEKQGVVDQSIEWCELDRFVELLREVKDEEEIALMKKAQAITDKAFARILDFIVPGMTEREVQMQLDRYMFEEGAQGLAFNTIVATGAHGSSPHAIPSDIPLLQGDAVVMDFGAKYGGYCSDMTRIIFIGTPSSELSHAWDTLCSVNESCERMIRAGVIARDVHNHAESLLAEAGYKGKMGHSLGHSVGIDIHESPNLSPLNSRSLQEGNVVTVDPGIYLPGKFGMRLEDFGVVTPDGFNVFTQSSHKMFIIDKLN